MRTTLFSSISFSTLKKSSLIIEALYRENQHIVSFPLKCYFSFTEKNENEQVIRVAFAVPKKTFKKAVDRNTLKRRMREAYRLNYRLIFEPFINQNEKQLQLFILYIGKEMLDYGNIEKNTQNILGKLLYRN
jgi:ribonuclease P protein component